MLSCLHILNAYLLTRRLIQAFSSCASIVEKSQVVYFSHSFLYESRLVMTLYQI